jgi:hypothetical protein
MSSPATHQHTRFTAHRYESGAEQGEVERYFSSSSTMGRAYWIGVNRTLAPNLYAYSDGGYLPQLPSAQPYAQWSWWFTRSAAQVDNNCVRASADMMYEQFIGDASLLAQLTSTSYYVTTGSSRRFGWTPVQCATPNPFVCEIPAGKFPCPSPPPGPPPDAPPPAIPGEPRAVTSACVPANNATFFCDGAAWCYGYRSEKLVFPKAQEACRCAGRAEAAAAAHCCVLNQSNQPLRLHPVLHTALAQPVHLIGRAIGGEVVKYWSFKQQLDVERYFAGTNVLTPLYYWIGISRVAKTMAFSYTYDKTAVVQVGTWSAGALPRIWAGNCRRLQAHQVQPVMAGEAPPTPAWTCAEPGQRPLRPLDLVPACGHHQAQLRLRPGVQGLRLRRLHGRRQLGADQGSGQLPGARSSQADTQLLAQQQQRRVHCASRASPLLSSATLACTAAGPAVRQGVRLDLVPLQRQPLRLHLHRGRQQHTLLASTAAPAGAPGRAGRAAAARAAGAPTPTKGSAAAIALQRQAGPVTAAQAISAAQAA